MLPGMCRRIVSILVFLVGLGFAAVCAALPQLLLKGHVTIGDGGTYVATVESAEFIDAGVLPVPTDASSPRDAAPDASAPDASPRDASAPDATSPDASVDAGPLQPGDAGSTQDAKIWALGMGTNLGEPYDYQGEWAFMNNFQQSRDWQSWGNYLQNRCCEERVLKWEGTGTIAVSGVQSQRADGPRRIVYVARPEIPDAPLDQQSVLIKRTGDVTNVVDVELRYEGRVGTELWHPLFRERLAPFSILRMMDWGHTNWSPQRNWADRPQPGRAVRTKDGVAYEDMIDLANASGKHLWICVPHMATDDYVRSLATLLRDRLNPNLLVGIEWSNEVWNDMFGQAQYARAEGIRLGLSSDAHHARLLYQARRSIEVWNIMRPIIGPRMAKILGGFLGDDTAWSTGVLLNATRGHAEVFAIAGYFYQMSSSSVTQTLGWAATHKRKADEFGVPLIAYEGGMHMIPGVSDSRNPQIYDRYVQLLRGWKTFGGGTFVHFTNAYIPGGYGSWGALEWTAQPIEQAHKYRALRDVSAEWSR